MDSIKLGDGHTLAKNIIYTGVAGTGKTYQLQQLAKAYTQLPDLVDQAQLLSTLLTPLYWFEVLCLVFLQQRQESKALLKVAEIEAHPFFKAKAQINQLNYNHKNVIWNTLQSYGNKDCDFINTKQRASQAYFDKDAASNWSLMPESLLLLQPLQEQLADYQAAIADQVPLPIERYSFVSFHQAYGYEEFVEGIRPKTTPTGQLSYSVEPGAFLQLCERARQDPNHRYAMLIDEINRANVTRVFGELMSVIEPTKRAGQTDALSVQLAYSKQAFSVPSNVDIYATMNTQDVSLVPLDMAFRRRFQFVECLPQPELLGSIKILEEVIDLAKLLTALNTAIVQQLGQDSQLGHSFLWHINSLDALADAFLLSVIPQVAQACHQNGHILQQIFGDRIIHVRTMPQSPYAPPTSAYTINRQALKQAASYQAIYYAI